MSSTIDQYMLLRVGFKEELDAVISKIDELDREKLELVARRDNLHDLLYSTPTVSLAEVPDLPVKPARKAPAKKAATKKPAPRKAPAKKAAAKKTTSKSAAITATQKSTDVKTEVDPPFEDRLIRIVRAKPGASRQYIYQAIAKNLSDFTGKDLTALLSKMSKKGLIVNKGNKRYSQWHLTPKSI